MAERVRQGLTCCQRRNERFVDSLEAILLDAPGNAQAVAQEAFSGSEQGEGVAVKLAIVEKLRAVDADVSAGLRPPLSPLGSQPHIGEAVAV